VTLKIVTGSSEDQEKPVAGTADTYLKLFGLAQATNSSTFDLENRIWPRPSDPNFELSLGSPGARTIAISSSFFRPPSRSHQTGLLSGEIPPTTRSTPLRRKRAVVAAARSRLSDSRPLPS